MKFEFPEYYNLAELMSEEEKMIKDSVSSFVDEEVLLLSKKIMRKANFH